MPGYYSHKTILGYAPNDMISRLPKFEKGVDENKNPFCIVLIYLVESPGRQETRGVKRKA
jgi:hypothetical protein